MREIAIKEPKINELIRRRRPGLLSKCPPRQNVNKRRPSTKDMRRATKEALVSSIYVTFGILGPVRGKDDDAFCCRGTATQRGAARRGAARLSLSLIKPSPYPPIPALLAAPHLASPRHGRPDSSSSRFHSLITSYVAKKPLVTSLPPSRRSSSPVITDFHGSRLVAPRVGLSFTSHLASFYAPNLRLIPVRCWSRWLKASVTPTTTTTTTTTATSSSSTLPVQMPKINVGAAELGVMGLP
ncbi:hypothetical protein E2C01_024099 [Portunus trituberculatus]|uniref:Uncharacterized protein n=1 Tax=Portunus trituberculatus TaxID=210409 RepID=A0A5B7E9H7_PORTR|nr:hypothetical protein [Portunus trituberculatus]